MKTTLHKLKKKKSTTVPDRIKIKQWGNSLLRKRKEMKNTSIIVPNLQSNSKIQALKSK